MPLHGAFDRGLISFDDEFKILASDNFAENPGSNYSIKQFQGKKMRLPENELFHPSRESLQ